MSSAFPLSPPSSHQKPGTNVAIHGPSHQHKQDWNLGVTSGDAPRTAERKRRGRMVDYIDSLPTPPSTRSKRSQHRNNFHFHADPGLPTPSTSTHKHHASERRPSHRASPFPESQRHGANIQNIKLLEEAESSSSEVEEDEFNSASAMSDRRWLGRRGSRRPGLTFAQQMGLIAARASEQHQSTLAIVNDSGWESTDVQRSEKERVHSTLWLSASNVSASRPQGIRNDAAKTEPSFENAGGFGASQNKTTQSNPFLDEVDTLSSTFTSASRKSCGPLRKTASGTLLDPVDIVAASPSSFETLKREFPSSTHQTGATFASTSVPAGHTVDASIRVHTEENESATEKEEDGEDEEEDDSPYLIEHDDDTGRHFEVREKESRVSVTDKHQGAPSDYAFEQQSDLSEMSELDEDDEEEGIEEEEDESHEELSEVDEGRSTSRRTSLEAAKDSRPSSITRYLSASKSSGSLSMSPETGKDQAESSSALLSRSLPKSSRGNNRERKSWGKPTTGNIDENPFLAPSGTAKPSKFVALDTGGSWLRTDNARMQKREGEKPTIDYVFRGQKTTFANPYYHHDPYHPPASSLLPPEHPEFSPAPVPAPRMLFPSQPTGNDDVDEDEAALFAHRRRDVSAGQMQSSPTAGSSTRPATQMLQRRISSQMPPIARQGSTLLERAQRVRVAQTESRAQPKASSRAQHTKKRSMEDVLGGMDDLDNGEDELLLRDSTSTARVLFGKRQATVAASQAQSDRPTQQTSASLRASANKRIKMEHVMGE
ncbi:hypothetical protein QFC22_003084 [Naganishia vaughanmartiniae]|uniref:Uncharacterized protein n=1 Tax=Naganishia vaughanmartiniae TaxID=1424756 RepID=A0ACC2X9A8_9TREE|nr:hypothetical protein QFC22_003084 [Naganishia vaughanmartiniae]